MHFRQKRIKSLNTWGNWLLYGMALFLLYGVQFFAVVERFWP